MIANTTEQAVTTAWKGRAKGGTIPSCRDHHRVRRVMSKAALRADAEPERPRPGLPAPQERRPAGVTRAGRFVPSGASFAHAHIRAPPSSERVPTSSTAW